MPQGFTVPKRKYRTPAPIARMIIKRPTSDLDIARCTHLWMQQHGDQALAKTREMVEGMRRKGDADGADVWLRIIAAITNFGTLPSEARR